MDECINELARKLNSLAEAGSRNRILPDQLQEWVLEYLRDWDEEVGRFPELGRERHWNLWMADCDFDKEAFFVGMIFGPTEIEVLYGRGESHSVRTFCENEFPEDLDKVIPQIRDHIDSFLDVARLIFD